MLDMGMDRATEVFWHTGAHRWNSLAEIGTAVLFEADGDCAVILATVEPVADLADLVARQDEGDFFRMIAIGNPDSVNSVLDRLRQQAQEGSLETLPGAGALPAPSRAMFQSNTRKGLADRHREWLGEHEGHEWDFFFSDSQLEVQPGDDHVSLLDLPTWRAEIERVITASNPITTALQDLDSLTWYGYIDGNLLGGAMGVERLENADGSLSSLFAGLGTDPEMQGRGIGGAVMSGTINRELKETGIVTFGMWSWNHRARKLYRKLGITEGYSYITLSKTPLKEYEA